MMQKEGVMHLPVHFLLIWQGTSILPKVFLLFNLFCFQIHCGGDIMGILIYFFSMRNKRLEIKFIKFLQRVFD